MKLKVDIEAFDGYKAFIAEKAVNVLATDVWSVFAAFLAVSA